MTSKGFRCPNRTRVAYRSVRCDVGALHSERGPLSVVPCRSRRLRQPGVAHQSGAGWEERCNSPEDRLLAGVKVFGFTALQMLRLSDGAKAVSLCPLARMEPNRCRVDRAGRTRRCWARQSLLPGSKLSGWEGQAVTP